MLKKIVITGAEGQLGRAFGRELSRRGSPFFGTDLSGCDITDPAAVEALLAAQHPGVLINCAAYNLVDESQDKPDPAFAVNAGAVKAMAAACQARGIKLVHFGTDYVFDGRKNDLYTEDDAPHPLNVYGESKREGEDFARSLCADHLVLRTSWVYGEGRQNFLYKVAQWAAKNRVLRISADEVSVPTSVDDLVSVTLKALERELTGLYHLTSSGYASRYELAKYFLKAAGLDVLAVPVPLASFQPRVPRPVFSAMSNRKISGELGIRIPEWQEGVEHYVRTNKGGR